MRKFKGIVLAGLITLVVLEVLVRLLMQVEPFYVRYIKNVGSAGHRLEWVRRRARHMLNAYDRCFQYDPQLGWRYKSNLTNSGVFNHKILNTNSKGIRGKAEYDYHKDPNKKRILIIGDSFVFGDEVSDTQTWPFYLQEMLPDAEIINMGVSGFGHDQMLIYLKEEGLKYKPDMVILGYMKIDERRNILSFRGYAKPRFDMRGDTLVLLNSPVDPPEKILAHEMFRSKLWDVLSIIRFDFLRKINYLQRYREVLADKILADTVALLKANHIKVVFAYTKYEFPQNGSEDRLEDRVLFADFCRRQQIDCIIPPLISPHLYPYVYMPGKHYTPSINRFTAKAVRDYLVNHREQ